MILKKKRLLKNLWRSSIKIIMIGLEAVTMEVSINGFIKTALAQNITICFTGSGDHAIILLRVVWALKLKQPLQGLVLNYD